MLCILWSVILLLALQQCLYAIVIVCYNQRLRLIGQDAVGKFCAPLHRCCWNGLRPRTTDDNDKRPLCSWSGNYSVGDSLGDCTSDQSRLSAATSSRRDRLCCWQRQNAHSRRSPEVIASCSPKESKLSSSRATWPIERSCSSILWPSAGHWPKLQDHGQWT